MYHFVLPFALALIASSPPTGNAAESMKFETILKQFDGGPTKAEKRLVQSAKEWNEFIDRCSAESMKEKLRDAKIDFAKETVIVVVVGPNSSILGHADYEKQAGVQRVIRGSDGVVVEYTNVHTDHRDTKARHPLHVVRIIKTKEVKFKGDAKFFGG